MDAVTVIHIVDDDRGIGHQVTPLVQLWRKAVLRVSWKEGGTRWSASETIWYPADGDPRTAVETTKARMKETYRVPIPGPGLRPEWSVVIDAREYEPEEEA